MAEVVLNGRVAQRTTVTGVERWTAELFPRLVRRRPDRYALLEPPAGASSRARGHAWEQLVLPARTARRGALLIFSPANLVPLLWPRNLVLMHDVAVLRAPDAYSRSFRIWHRWLGLGGARRALKVLTVSQFSKRELVSLAGLDPEKLVVIGGGVGPRFAPGADHQRVAARLGLRRPYVLTVGTNDRRKNLGSLVRAARALDELGIELVWAGGARPQFTHTAPVAGLRRLGYVGESDLPGLYAGAAAFVMPSRYEGLGLPCLEAMACGTPVVAANRAALPETCGDAALLVDPDDEQAIADAVLQAVTDARTRARLREAGLLRAAQSTWERAAADADAVLDELLSPGSALRR